MTFYKDNQFWVLIIHALLSYITRHFFIMTVSDILWTQIFSRKNKYLHDDYEFALIRFARVIM